MDFIVTLVHMEHATISKATILKANRQQIDRTQEQFSKGLICSIRVFHSQGVRGSNFK